MIILIASPRFIHRQGESFYFPVGLSYISACLKRAGHEVHCLNLNAVAGNPDELVREALERSGARLFCAGGLSVHYAKVRQLLEVVREADPTVVTVGGGGLVSSEPEAVMTGLGADYGVIGEGDQTMVELAQALERGDNPADVPGLILRIGNAWLRTPEREAIEDLDSLPYPDYENFGLREYIESLAPNSHFYTYAQDNPREVPIIASRSCPFQCTFCYHPLGNKYRQRSIPNIIAEIDYWIERFQINMVILYDELFATRNNPERVLEFCGHIRSRGVKWMAALRVDCITPELLRTMREAGCFYISFGLESASNTVLKSMRKGITVEQIAHALRLCHEEGIGTQGNFIFGDAAETWQTARETLDWWRAHLAYQVNLTGICTYPGSRLYTRARERGLIGSPLEYIEQAGFMVNNTSMSDAELTELYEQIEAHTREDMIIWADLLEYGFAGVDRFGRKRFDIAVLCPHCGRRAQYKGLHHNGFHWNYAGMRLKLPCRHCNQRFDTVSLRALDRMTLADQVGQDPAALWCAGGHTRELLSSGRLAGLNIVCVFDGDPAKAGSELGGLPVLSGAMPPEAIRGLARHIIISSEAFELEIERSLEHLKDHGIVLHTLYR